VYVVIAVYVVIRNWLIWEEYVYTDQCLMRYFLFQNIIQCMCQDTAIYVQVHVYVGVRGMFGKFTLFNIFEKSLINDG